MEWNWLQLIAALGSGISLITLSLTILFRWWDSRTRLDITFRVTGTKDESNFLSFRVVNNSKTPVHISRGYLEYGDGQSLRLGVAGGAGAFSVGTYHGMDRYQLPPRFPMEFETGIVALAESLLDEGCEEPVRLTFVTYDGTGTRHEQPLLFKGLAEWKRGDTNGPCPTNLPRPPWWQRWFGG